MTGIFIKNKWINILLNFLCFGSETVTNALSTTIVLEAGNSIVLSHVYVFGWLGAAFFLLSAICYLLDGGADDYDYHM